MAKLQTMAKTALVGLALAGAACKGSENSYEIKNHEIYSARTSDGICATITRPVAGNQSRGLILQDTTTVPRAVQIGEDYNATRVGKGRDFTDKAYLKWEETIGGADAVLADIEVFAPAGHRFHDMSTNDVRELYRDITKWKARGLRNQHCWEDE